MQLIIQETIPIGTTGTLSLGLGGGASVGFAVRSLHPDGGMGVLFDQATASPGFAAVMQRLAETPTPRAA